METTKFIEDPTPGPLLRTQAVIYGATTLLSVGLLVLGGTSWWTHRHDAEATIDPNSFRGGLSQVYDTWKRDVLHATPTPAPAIQPAAQMQQPTPAQVAQVQPTATPYQPTDEDMAQWKHIPPGQEQHYAEYQRRLSQAHPTPAPTPFPTPYLAPEVVAATPDPVAARYGAWKTMRDAYAKQQLVRAQNAKSDAEKGQIQREIALWRQNNPEPPKPATSQNPDEIPIR